MADIVVTRDPAFETREIRLRDGLIGTRENSRVILTLMPSSVSCRIAGTPSTVPGTLIMTFRGRWPHNLRASSTVPACRAQEAARPPELTKPSRPCVSSNTGCRIAAASRMSAIARTSYDGLASHRAGRVGHASS